MRSNIRAFFAHLFYLWQRLTAVRCDGGEGQTAAVTVETGKPSQCEYIALFQCQALGPIHFLGSHLCREHAIVVFEKEKKSFEALAKDERLLIEVDFWKRMTDVVRMRLEKEVDLTTAFQNALRDAKERAGSNPAVAVETKK